MIKIRPLIEDDYVKWLEVYRYYAEHYEVSLTDAGIKATWSWLMEPNHPLNGIVAEIESIVGLAHYRAMPSPLRGMHIGFLDDLIVKPSARGSGAARMLLGELKVIAKREEWPAFRWITRDDNYRARSLYDKVASKTDWNVYEMNLED